MDLKVISDPQHPPPPTAWPPLQRPDISPGDFAPVLTGSKPVHNHVFMLHLIEWLADLREDAKHSPWN